MFRHPGAIFRELLQQRCTCQPVILYLFVVVSLIKKLAVKIYKIYKIDIVSNLQCFVNTFI